MCDIESLMSNNIQTIISDNNNMLSELFNNPKSLKINKHKLKLARCTVLVAINSVMDFEFQDKILHNRLIEDLSNCMDKISIFMNYYETMYNLNDKDSEISCGLAMVFIILGVFIGMVIITFSMVLIGAF